MKAKNDTKEEKKPTGAQSLAEAIDTMKKIMAEDLQKACKSEETFTFLSLSADIFNRILKVITMFDTGKAIKPELKDKVLTEIGDTITNEEPDKPKLNIQDFVLKK